MFKILYKMRLIGNEPPLNRLGLLVFKGCRSKKAVRVRCQSGGQISNQTTQSIQWRYRQKRFFNLTNSLWSRVYFNWNSRPKRLFKCKSAFALIRQEPYALRKPSRRRLSKRPYRFLTIGAAKPSRHVPSQGLLDVIPEKHPPKVFKTAPFPQR